MTTRVNRGPQPKALAIVAVVAAAGLAVTFILGRGGTSSAEKRAVDIADNVIPSVMDPSDMTAPVVGSRYDQISTALEKTIDDPAIERITVWGKGVVVFSTTPDLVGLLTSGMEAKPLVDEALAGKVASSVGVGDSMPTGDSESGEAFRTFAPIRFQPGDPVLGVVEIVQPVPTGSDSQLVSTLKFAFNVILVVSLIWLYIAMGRPSEKAARARRYEEKLRRQGATAPSTVRAGAESARQAPAEILPAADGPLFAAEAPARQTRTDPARTPTRGVSREVAAMDTWAFGPGAPESAARKPSRIKPTLPKTAKPATVEPTVAEHAAVEPAAVEPAAVEPAVAEPIAPAVPAVVGSGSSRLDDADQDDGEHTKEEVDPGAWIVPRSEQEARRRDAMASGAPQITEAKPAALEPAGTEAASAEADREGFEVARDAQATRDTRDEEREAAKTSEREVAEAKKREAAETSEADRLARAAEREAAQAILAAELKAMNAAADQAPEEEDGKEREAAKAKEREAAEAKEREAAKAREREAEAAEKHARAREAAATEAQLAREESARAAERAIALRDRARAAEEAARAASEEISALEVEIRRLEEARRLEDRAREKVRAAQDAARAARQEELQLEEEARRLREGLRSF